MNLSALYRAMRAVPGHTLDEYRVPGKRVALRVTSQSCPACESFEKRRLKYEKTLGVDVIFVLSADDAKQRALALSSGVTQIPCYIRLSGRDTVDIVRP